MLRTIFCAFIALILLIIILIPSLISLALRKRNPYSPIPRIANSSIKFFVRSILCFSGIKLETKGKENLPADPAYFAGNHQSYFDIAALLMEFGEVKPIIAKKELSLIPLVSIWMKAIACIFLERGDPRKELRSLAEAQKLLENGLSVMVFPEGTRSKGPDMGEFKSGSFRCAIKAGVPVVPFAVEGGLQML